MPDKLLLYENLGFQAQNLSKLLHDLLHRKFIQVVFVWRSSLKKYKHFCSFFQILDKSVPSKSPVNFDIHRNSNFDFSRTNDTTSSKKVSIISFLLVEDYDDNSWFFFLPESWFRENVKLSQ